MPGTFHDLTYLTFTTTGYLIFQKDKRKLWFPEGKQFVQGNTDKK